MTKDLANILDAIDKWSKKNKGKVAFIGSFVSYDPKKIKEGAADITKDAIMVGFGERGEIDISLEGIRHALGEDKEDFISW